LGRNLEITQSRSVRPPIAFISLSPPPIRLANPPARITPIVRSLSVIGRDLLQVVRRSRVFDMVKDDALGAR
jgi:hypothetical protein